MHARRLVASLFALLLALLLAPGLAQAQYNEGAGANAPKARMKKMEVMDEDTGKVRVEMVEEKVARDSFGNAAGSQHDLAIDGAFEGQTIVVLQFYVDSAFDFSLPRDAVAEKGFSVYRFSGTAPSPEDLSAALEKANQLWIIAGDQRHLTDVHLEIIKRFFEAGHGLYIWGDNDPFYSDANYVASALFETKMEGNLPGDQVVGVQSEKGDGAGIIANHLLSTGLENIYEGVTIATIQKTEALTPLIYGSANNLVAAFYDQDGKRAIFDGGFTRLYVKWDSAGTPRYIKNAAAWLANYERFGEEVLATTTEGGEKDADTKTPATR